MGEATLKPKEFLQEAQEEAATGAAAASTDHSEETTNLPAEKQAIYSIVNAFCNDITFHFPESENILVAEQWSCSCDAPAP